MIPNKLKKIEKPRKNLRKASLGVLFMHDDRRCKWHRAAAVHSFRLLFNCLFYFVKLK